MSGAGGSGDADAALVFEVMWRGVDFEYLRERARIGERVRYYLALAMIREYEKAREYEALLVEAREILRAGVDSLVTM